MKTRLGILSVALLILFAALFYVLAFEEPHMPDTTISPICGADIGAWYTEYDGVKALLKMTSEEYAQHCAPDLIE